VEPRPIRPIDSSERIDNTLHDKLVAVFGRMLEQLRRKHAAESDGERELLGRHIGSTDREIDELAYEL